MNKAQLIETLIAKHSEKRGSIQISKADMTAVVEGLGEIVQAQLAQGEDITLPGIGKFAVTERAARAGRNPKTGETIEIPARKAPKFSAAKTLKDALN